MLKTLRELLKTETAADISAALASIDIPSLRAAVESAKTTRAGLLLTGSDAEILSAEKAIETARLDADRAEAAVVELERRLAVATEAERIAALTTLKADVIRERDEVARLLEKEYAKHANALIGIIRRIIASDSRISQLNQSVQINGSGEEFIIDRGAEALFLKGEYNAMTGNITSFANIPPAPGVSGYWAGKQL